MVSSLIDDSSRRSWLFGFLVALSILTVLVLEHVLWTVVFAIVIAYIMYPSYRRLTSYGLSDRQASVSLTLFVLGAITAFIAPAIYVLFQRRNMLLDFLRELPATIPVEIYGYTHVIETGIVLSMLRDWLSEFAITIAELAPNLLLKLSLMMFLIAALLYRPEAVKTKFIAIFSSDLQEIVERYHVRVKETLFGIFRVQLTTAFATFLIALPFFYLLGYDVFFSLAFFSGILQLIPIIGPSLLILGLFVFELAAVDFMTAGFLLVVGIIAIGVLPDILVRPRLANQSMGIPPSLYILGFIGGVLTVGIIGLIIGPLLIALILETVDMLVEDQDEG